MLILKREETGKPWENLRSRGEQQIKQRSEPRILALHGLKKLPRSSVYEIARQSSTNSPRFLWPSAGSGYEIDSAANRDITRMRTHLYFLYLFPWQGKTDWGPLYEHRTPWEQCWPTLGLKRKTRKNPNYSKNVLYAELKCTMPENGNCTEWIKLSIYHISRACNAVFSFSRWFASARHNFMYHAPTPMTATMFRRNAKKVAETRV